MIEESSQFVCKEALGGNESGAEAWASLEFNSHVARGEVALVAEETEQELQRG